MACWHIGSVISDRNRSSKLPNSDLEMAAVLIQQSVLEALVPVRHERAQQQHAKCLLGHQNGDQSSKLSS
jgi:hypothetical protein